MYTLKGFITVDGLANASPTVVAAIGELSTLSRTFALGVGEIASAPLPYTLNAFLSTTVSGPTSVPVALQTQVFSFVDWAFTLQKGSTPAATSAAFTTAMTTQFGSQASSIGCGNLINNGTFNFPEYITWTNNTLVTNDPTTGGLVKLWFCDASFQSQYDGYTIKVVPPLNPVDLFGGGAAAVATALSGVAVGSTLNAITTAAAGYPYTELVPQTFDYVDPTNPSNTISTQWAILIYGAAGNNIDAIRAAVQAYITANSALNVSVWQQIFPEIYNTTEFLILPRWYNYAINQQQLTAGVYSEIVNLNKELTYLANVLSTLTPAFIQAHAVVLPVQYKSLQVLVVPQSTNAVAQQDLINLFPDLINVPTTDTSYNLMSTKTRQFLTMLLQMVIQAENATVQSTLPAGMSSAARYGILCVAQAFNGITYLVATKGSTPNY